MALVVEPASWLPVGTNVATIVSAPTGRALSVHDAVLPMSTTAAQTVDPPVEKVTVPVTGVIELCWVVTVAVAVVVWSKVEKPPVSVVSVAAVDSGFVI
jgi:hypothetical protein